MSTRSVLLGSLQLKKLYQRNMAIGFGIAGGAHLLIIGIIAIIIGWESDKPIAAGGVVIKTKADLILPPTLKKPKEDIRVATPERVIKPSVGVPEPVPDEEAPEEVEIATQDELADMAPVMPVEDLDDLSDLDVESVLEEFMPSPDDFIPVEEQPTKVIDVKPIYPDLAQRAGIEGDVWIKALVDKEGKVRDVIIVRDSGANAGFEDAAEKAAYETVWRPAIANGQPVALWVTYKVQFKLRDN